MVAGKLTADSGFMAVQQHGNGTLAMTGFHKDGNLVSFVLGEVCVVHFGQLRRGGQGARMLPHLARLTH